MELTSTAEALYQAHKGHATGTLTLTARGRSCELKFQDGNLVGAQVGFGHRTLAQALLQEGLLDATQLDTLWANGDGGGEASLDALRIARQDADAAQWFATVKVLTAMAEARTFTAGAVDASMGVVSGMHLVRAAYEVTPQELGDGYFRCRDFTLCTPWLRSQMETMLLTSAMEFTPLEGLNEAQLGLVSLLLREGAVELLSKAGFEARVQAEEFARKAEEAERRAFEEAARAAAQPPPLEPPPLPPLPEVEANPLFEAAPAAPAAPAEEPSWGDFVSATEMPPAQVVPPAAPVSMEVAEAEPEAMLELAPTDIADGPIDVAGAVDGEALAKARADAQARLIAEMNEALRRAGSLGNDAQSGWLSESMPQPTKTNPPPVPVKPPKPSTPAPWMGESRRTTKPPLILGPTAAPRAEEDLWRIVSSDEGVSADDAHSFEEALAKVDAQLEDLVGLIPSTGTSEEPPVEAIVEATFEPPGWPSDTVADAGDNLEESWPFDEEDLATDPSDPAEAARLRRQRLLRRAMSNMGTMGQRGPATPAPMGIAAPALTPAPPPQQGADEVAFAERIEKRYHEIGAGMDKFTILALEPSATKEQVKSAFLEAAKQYHPDRLPLTLQHLSPKMTAIFEAVRESYETLYDEARRKAYMATLQAAQEDPQKDRRQRAEEAFKRGELAFKKKEFALAEEQYSIAHELEPKAIHLAAQAWAMYQDPARKADVGRAKQLMQDALKLDPKCDRAFYQLGVIARVEGDNDKAERYFREAVKANPKHLEAGQELRLIEMRRKKEPPKKGLFR